jgi:hypothetical protein
MDTRGDNRMTDKGDRMVPPRISTEPFSSGSGRAVVINYTLAWTIFVTALGALIAGVVWVTSIDNRVSALEARRVGRDAQFEAIDNRFSGVEQRLRPLEITTASIALLRDQIINGFADINRRLDRAEDAKP